MFTSPVCFWLGSFGLALAALSSTAAYADACDPRLAVCSGQACSSVELGTTMIDRDHTSLIACLAQDSTQTSFIWKSLTQGVGASAVMAFNSTTCPAGWSLFSPAAGRVLLGAGSGNVDMNGAALTPRVAGTAGGEETHKLTIAEMPSHQHDSGWGEFTGGPFGMDYARGGGQYGSNKSDHDNYLFMTSAVGGDQAHNTMMPYYVMTFCVKN